jgi:Bacterial Ig-like domain (group 3)/NHL repeat
MRLFGHQVCRKLPVFRLGLVLSLGVLPISAALGQSAPQVLPYTMSTFAGAHAAYTAPAACGNYVALDAAGDGCLASQVSVGSDPHDIRVDPKGFLFYLDNAGSSGLVHKINPYTLQETVYAGSLVVTKACTQETTKYGDNCISTDGAANVTTNPGYTAGFKLFRGIATGNNGDLVIGGYNDYYIHKIAAATSLMSVVTGTGATGTSDAGGQVGQVRGVGVDAAGNIYLADTSNNLIRKVTPAGVLTTLSAANAGGTKQVNTTPIALSAALFDGPEDIKVDSYGNLIIADFGNNVIRAVYNSGPFFGISNPIPGDVYTIAGLANVTPPTTAVYQAFPTTVLPATTVAISTRKISLDAQGNVYMADSGFNVVWFLDRATGNIRVLAGYYGPAGTTITTAATTPATPVCSTAANSVGDGCPGTGAALYANSNMGTSTDNLGDVFITDAQGPGNSAGARIRELLSGLNFAPLATGSSVTQTVQLHFAPADRPAGSNPYVLTANTDFSVGSATCTVQADNTDDCLLTVTFTPSHPGYDTAQLTVTSKSDAQSVFVLTGNGMTPSVVFDPGSLTQLAATTKNPNGIAFDGGGNAYIADTGNNRVLFYNASTNATTVFAGGSANCGGASDSFGDGCPATSAMLNAPRAVAIDTFGNLYIADTGNNIIRKVNDGIITLFAGGASSVCSTATDSQGDGCPALNAIFTAPAGLATDSLGQVFVADSGHNLIRQISLSTYVSTLAGGASAVCSGAVDAQGDGCPALQTTFANPSGLAFDYSGKNLFIADTGDNLVRKLYFSDTFTVSGANATNIEINPVSLVAGDGQPGATVDPSGAANKSQLNVPQGVAVDAAGNAYIADTGNHAVRLVNGATGMISTIAGIITVSGNTAVPASATTTQLNLTGAVAVTPAGNLFIADSGNNRILSDARMQVSYSFGRTNVGAASSLVNFSELNVGTSPATLGSTLFTAVPASSAFTLTAAPNGNGSIPACVASGTLTPGAICNLQAQFSPTAAGSQSATFTANTTNGTLPPAVASTISLTGVGAVLTTTTSTVTQTTPATGNPQFGGPFTLTATITPSTCNTAAPSCSPSGTVTVVVDGVASAPLTLSSTGTANQPITGLAVGAHTVSCNYSGDDFYAASTCGSQTITVSLASTTSAVAIANNNKPQFTTVTLTAAVASNTTGTPVGSVTFYANGNSLGSSPLNSGVANLALQQVVVNGVQQSNTTLLPGTYSITCTYSGGSNYAGSSCAAATLVVVPDQPTLTLTPRGCGASQLYFAGTSTPGIAQPCTSGAGTPTEQFKNGIPNLAVAQGSTTDATIFISPSNTVTGTLTFSCSGLPTASTCTFSPTSINLAGSPNYVPPTYTDMTLWTDLQPGTGTARLARPTLGAHSDGISLAALLGWPAAVLALFGMLMLRRKSSRGRALQWLLVLVAMVSSSVGITGCGGGPGAYQVNPTPAGS